MPNPDADIFDLLYDPLVLHGEVFLPAQGSSASPNAAALTNPHGVPMEILEVRFTAYPVPNVPTAFTANAFAQVTGAGVGVKLDLGGIPISDANVTMWNFDEYRRSLGSYFGASGGAANGTGNLIAVGGTPTTAAALAATAEHGWKLKHPLFVPPGASLVPTFTHLGQTPHGIMAKVSYICRTYRSGSPRPKKLIVPWVCAYNSKSFDILNGAAASNDESGENDLSNPFTVPLELQRITGRWSTYVVGDGSTNFQGATDARGLDYAARLLTLRMRGSRGDELVREFVPWEAVFPRGARSWELPDGWRMQSREFYKVFLKSAAVDMTPLSYTNARIQFFVGLVGYREVSP